MRFLKRKVNLRIEDSGEDYSDFEDSQEKFIVKQEELSKISSCETASSPLPQKQSKKGSNMGLRGPRKNKTATDADSKNIIKNYGKALCAFASSKIAIPYLQKLAIKGGYHDFNIKKFMQQMQMKKKTTNSMEHLRQILIEEDGDSIEQRIFKRIFKDVSIIFMKYFAVNWIFSGKLVQKNIHMKFRFKMMRRIQNPEYFTYLKTTVKSPSS